MSQPVTQLFVDAMAQALDSPEFTNSFTKTLEDAAEVSHGCFRAILAGERTPNMSTVVAICGVLGIEFDAHYAGMNPVSVEPGEAGLPDVDVSVGGKPVVLIRADRASYLGSWLYDGRMIDYKNPTHGAVKTEMTAMDQLRRILEQQVTQGRTARLLIEKLYPTKTK